MSKKVTIKDIAKLANVSETTVSLVLNDAPSRICVAKKQEIKDIAKKLNYVPNHFARSLSKRKSKTIGLILPNIEKVYFSSIAKHIDEIMRLNGYLVYVISSDENFENDKSSFLQLVNRQVDGIIICLSNDFYDNVDENKKFFSENNFGIPVLFLSRAFDDAENYIVFDNELGGFLATEFFIEKFNSKNIIFISKDLEIYNEKLKYDGYAKALKKYNLDLDRNLIFNLKDYSIENIRKIVENKNIDGIFCCSYFVAFAIVASLNFREDAKIIVYDYSNEKEMFGFKLNYVYDDVKLLSTESCNAMFDLIEGKRRNVQIILEPCFKIV